MCKRTVSHTQTTQPKSANNLHHKPPEPRQQNAHAIRQKPTATLGGNKPDSWQIGQRFGGFLASNLARRCTATAQGRHRSKDQHRRRSDAIRHDLSPATLDRLRLAHLDQLTPDQSTGPAFRRTSANAAPFQGSAPQKIRRHPARSGTRYAGPPSACTPRPPCVDQSTGPAYRSTSADK